MAVKGIGFVTLADVAKKGDKVAEVLTLKNSMLMDIPYMEMNEKTIHKESIRSYLPAPVYRKANQAIAAQKTGIEERTFTAAHFESRSQMDAKVAERGGKDKIAMNRWNQAQGHIQGMANEHAKLIVYGSPSGEGDKNIGFNDVYYTVNAAVETSKQVVDAGGTGSDNTSILMVNRGPQSIFGVYPAGTQAGLKRTDYSAGGKLVQLQGLDTSGNPGTFYGYDEIFEIDHGLVVKDFRQACRIANVDVSNAKANVSAADLIDLLITASYRLDDAQGAIIYLNRTMHGVLHKQARTSVSVGGGLTFDNYEGQKLLHFNGMPIRIQDSISNTEARVV